MKNKMNNIIRRGMLLGLTAIAALCMAPRVRAGGGTFYATVTNVTQLVGDINYANTVGGTFAINPQPNTTFDLITYNGSDSAGADMLPIIGGPKAVNLTILGNGDTLQRDPTNALYEIRLLEVGSGSSLTLDNMTLQYGYCYGHNGGAIYNSGTLVVSNCTLSGNLSYYSGYTSDVLGGDGGGIYNNGTVTAENHSSITGNDADDLGPDIYNLGQFYLEATSTIGVLDGYSAIGLSPVLSINSWSPAAHQLVLSWSTNYSGCTLQSSTGLGSTNWTDCASPAVSGASFVVTNSMSAGAQFFRLKR